MTNAPRPRPLRLWPGVTIVALQLVALYAPGYFAPATLVQFFAVMGSFTVGTLLLFIWWLFFSRARWSDRLGGLALLIVVHVAAIFLAHPSATVVTLVPGVPWLCAVFVGSLFFGRRAVTVVAVLVASLGWTLVRTEGVTGTFSPDYAWRWSPTAEERFLASDASAVPAAPVAPAVAGAIPRDLEAIEPPDAAAIATAAWPGFRGPRRDNVVAGVTIDPDWSRNPPQEIWRRSVGPGWSSFALAGNRLCTEEQRGEDEVVVCYDAATGEPIWLHAYSARFWEALGGAGPRATPTYHDGRLYTLGATGVLNCLDAATGDPVWTRNISDDTGARVPNWGFASSPLVIDDLVIVHAAGAPDGRAVVAYDLATGEPRWFGQAGGGSYSSPHLTTIDGVRQIVMVTGDGAFGLDPQTGDLLWKHAWPMGIGGDRIVQPAILEDGDILIGTSAGLGTRRISVSLDASGTWTADEVWTSRGLKPYYNDLVVHRGTAFGFDGSILAAIDLATGDRAWKGGRYGNGQVLLLPDQDLLLVLSERGELALVRASPERFEEVARMQALHGKTWNHPVVADGVVYVRNSEEAAAYRLPV
jgi:outer membrane protein assembly factor BamB